MRSSWFGSFPSSRRGSLPLLALAAVILVGCSAPSGPGGTVTPAGFAPQSWGGPGGDGTFVVEALPDGGLVLSAGLNLMGDEVDLPRGVGDVTFDPSLGTYVLARLDADGAWEWFVQGQRAPFERVAQFGDGSFLVAGLMNQSTGTLRAGGATTELGDAEDERIGMFAAGITAEGAVAWTKSWPLSMSPFGAHVGDAFALADGSVLLAGSASDPVTFDTEDGPVTLDPEGTVNMTFVARVTSDGSIAWATKVGGDAFEDAPFGFRRGLSFAARDAGGVYAIVREGTGAGGYRTKLATLSDDGDWSKVIDLVEQGFIDGTPEQLVATSAGLRVAVDFATSVNLPCPAPEGVVEAVEDGNMTGIAVAAITPEGACTWQTYVTASTGVALSDAVARPDGSVLVAGAFSRDATFRDATGTKDVTDPSGDEANWDMGGSAFIAEVSAEGTWTWMTTTSGDALTEYPALALGPGGHVAVLGTYAAGDLTLETETGSVTLKRLAAEGDDESADAFLAWLEPDGSWKLE